MVLWVSEYSYSYIDGSELCGDKQSRMQRDNYIHKRLIQMECSAKAYILQSQPIKSGADPGISGGGQN